MYLIDRNYEKRRAHPSVHPKSKHELFSRRNPTQTPRSDETTTPSFSGAAAARSSDGVPRFVGRVRRAIRAALPHRPHHRTYAATLPASSPIPPLRLDLILFSVCPCVQTRYVMKYRHCDGKLVLKVTDNRQVRRPDFLSLPRARFQIPDQEWCLA